MLKNLLVCLLSLLSYFSNSQSHFFIENKGQILDQNGQSREDVKYYLYHPKGSLFITEKGFSIQLEAIIDSSHLKIDRVDYSFQGFYPSFFEEIGQQNSHENYVSKDLNISCSIFSELRVSNIDKSMSLHFFITDEGFKYDIELTENYSKKEVYVDVKGGEANVIEDRVEVRLGNKKIVEQMPLVTNYYNSVSKKVPASYSKNGSGYTIAFDEFKGQLVIDPLVTYGTYYGGTYSDQCFDITSDSLNNVYLLGYSSSAQNIATTGAYQQTIGTYGGFYLAKLNELGQRQWGTYYHTSYSNPRRIDVDDQGYLYLSGMTGSGMNLGTPGTHQTAFGGDYNDVFLAKFTNDGFPVWSTLFGGSGNDIIDNMVVENGEIYLIGYTNSPNAIATSGSFQEIKGGNGSNNDGYIAKFDTTGNLIVSTYFGGFNNDQLSGIDFYDNHIYVVGAFDSFGLGTPGTYFPNKTANSDLFFSKFDTNLNRIWSSYFSGNRFVEGNHRLVAHKDKIYISGYVNADNGNTAYASGNTHKTIADLGYEGFIEVFDTTGQNWIKGTLFGGLESDYISSIELINDSTIAVAGNTNSFSGIATQDVHKNYFTYATSAFSVYQDAFVAVFNDSLIRVWGSYYGGEGEDFAYNLEKTNKNELLLCGSTTSQNGIAFGFAHQQFNGGSLPQPDGFLVKFDADRDSIFTDKDSTLPATICPKENLMVPVTVKGTFFEDNIFELWISDEFGDFSSAVLLESISGTSILSFSFQVPYLVDGGNYKFRVNSTSPAFEGSASKSILILTTPMANFNYQIGVNDVYFADISNSATSWIWDFGDGATSTSQHPNHIYGTPGWYDVKLVASNGTCTDTVLHQIVINEISGIENLSNTLIIYPNPTIDFWTINLPPAAKKTLVHNVQGQLIEEVKATTSLFFGSNYDPGIYWITVYGKDNELIILKKAIKL